MHEWHLGLFLVALDLTAAARGAMPLASGRGLCLLLVGLWLIAKDWRDLHPSTRDSAAWQIGLHRPPPPLRSVRHGDSLPSLAALFVAAVATVNLVWALGPQGSWLDDLLPPVRPLTSIPVFHSVALPAAAALSLCAIALLRRRRAAWAVVLAVLVVLAVVSLLRGFDIREASLSIAGAGALWCGRNAFYVRGPRPFARTLRDVAGLIAASLGSALAFIVLVVHTEPSTATREGVSLALWQTGEPIHLADEAAILPLLLKLLSLTLIVACAYVLFRRPTLGADLPDEDARLSARALVRAQGSDTLAFFKLRRDVRYLFTEDRTAFLAYRVEAGVLVLSGDPVGSRSAFPELLRRACSFAEEHGLRLAAIGVGEQLLPLYRQAGLRSFYLGDEAVVESNRFSLEGRSIRKVRQSVSRLERAGYSVGVAELGTLSADELAELQHVAALWRRGRRERGFSMALGSLRADEHAETLVVTARDRSGTARAFLHFAPVYGRGAVSLAAMCRNPESPNGLTEFLVVRAIELLRERGICELSLNFAAFARLLHEPRGFRERLLGRLVKALNPYFQIESLYRFNAKFVPRWERRYLVYEGRLGFPRAALAAVWAEGQLPRLPPWSGLARARLLPEPRLDERVAATGAR